MTPHENNTQDRGPWMLTRFGYQFYPLDPKPEDFRIEEIAEALAKTCRYNGHCPGHYSVAEHCVHLSNYFLDKINPNMNEKQITEYYMNAQWALIHDAAETYIGDMIRPIKWMFPDFTKVESKIEQVIFYDALEMTETFPEIVKEADTLICNDERHQLWEGVRYPPTGELVVEMLGYDKKPKLGIKVERWDWETAKEKYIETWEQLF